MKLLYSRILSVLVCLLLTENLYADVAEAPASGPYDELNRSTPRSSLLALAAAAKEKDYTLAVNYLDLRNLSFSFDATLDGEELAKKEDINLKIIDIVESAGVQLVISARTIYHKPPGIEPSTMPRVL